MKTASKAHCGQAMLEALLAVIVITCLFLGLFEVSRMLETKMFVEHAAMRVSRARAVGFNSYMCEKTARVCVIPVAGERLVPAKNDLSRGDGDDLAAARMYLRTPDSAYAKGLLDYEHWPRLDPGLRADGSAHPRFALPGHTYEGDAKVDEFPIYMKDEGL